MTSGLKIFLYKNLIRYVLPVYVAGGIIGTQLGNAVMTMQVEEPVTTQELDYRETTKDVENPGRGFYNPVNVQYKKDGNQVPEVKGKLLHFRMDISTFSKEPELSEDMLRTFGETLGELRERQCCAILRFAYDPAFSGKKTYEPSMEIMERHQEQLGEVISQYADVVVCVECGLFGKWGEMHGSTACTTENFNAAIDTWLRVLPESVPVSVRTPKQYCDWRHISTSDLKNEDLDDLENAQDTSKWAWRVGIYNDGYLASDTDLGTYLDRDTEVDWLSRHARHTTFGGELGSSYGSSKGITPTAEYMAYEAFLTHLTYLNAEWNDRSVNALKRETYDGEDETYQGQTGFTYVRNHMGYRLVLRDVRMTTEVAQKRKALIEADVENVGFGNIVKPKEVTLLLVRKDTGSITRIKLQNAEKMRVENCDVSTWDSQTTKTLRILLPINEAFEIGEYQAYLRIADQGGDLELGENHYPIRFANEGDQVWNEELGANYLGTICVTPKEKELDWDFKEGITWK